MHRWLLLLLVSGALAFGQAGNHVNWTVQFSPDKAAPGAHVLARMHAKIDPGWHLYSLSTPPPPIATSISLGDGSVVSIARTLQPVPVSKFDPNFNAKTETFEGDVELLVDLQVRKDAPAGNTSVTLRPRYQTCSDTSCIPPKTKDVEASFTVDGAAVAGPGCDSFWIFRAEAVSGF